MRKGVLIMPYNTHITGQVIGKLRVERGLTQEQLSGLANIGRSHLTAIEIGKKVLLSIPSGKSQKHSICP